MDETSLGAGVANSKRAALIPIISEVLDGLRKTLVERGGSYQDYEDNASVHVGLMNEIFNRPRLIGGWRKWAWAEGALMQITSKLSRIAMHEGEFHRDNWVDIAGYAICATAILDRQRGPVAAKPDSMYEEVMATQGEEPMRLPTRAQIGEPIRGPGVGGAASVAPVASRQVGDFGWALDQLWQCHTVRRAAWPAKASIWMEGASRGVARHIAQRVGFGFGQWAPIPADLLAFDWELCPKS